MIQVKRKERETAESLIRRFEGDFDVVILDLKMPDLSGLEVLQGIKAHDPTIEVIMLTGHGLQRLQGEMAVLAGRGASRPCWATSRATASRKPAAWRASPVSCEVSSTGL